MELPPGYVEGLKAWAAGDPDREALAAEVIRCGKFGYRYRCLLGHLSFNHRRCSHPIYCPTDGRRESDGTAQLAADDFAVVVEAIRELRAAGGPAGDRFDHRLALIGVVATIPQWLERWIRPGDPDSQTRLWRAFERFVSVVFPGTGIFAGLDWFGDHDSRIRPHVDARILNVRRAKDGIWSTFAPRIKSCVKHDWNGHPLNARRCKDADPCKFHSLRRLWSACLRKEMEPMLPATLDGEVRDWNVIPPEVRWDPLESGGKRHAPDLALDWDDVIAARCSYSAKPPVEVVGKWSNLERKEKRDGVVPPEVFDALRALHGSRKEKATRRIRRFGWMSPSVRKKRIAELGREVRSLAEKVKLIPVCGSEECFAKAEKFDDLAIEANRAGIVGLPLLRWEDPEVVQRWRPPAKPPAKYEDPNRKKTVRREFIAVAGTEEITFRYRDVVEKVPVEDVDPWICERCHARIFTASRPTWCLRDHGGCGRHQTFTDFAHAPKDDGIRLPYSWWVLEWRRVLAEATIGELDRHDQEHGWPATDESCELCAVEITRPKDDETSGSNVENRPSGAV